MVTTDPDIAPSINESVLAPITFSICGLAFRIYSGRAKKRPRKVTIPATMAFQDDFSRNPLELSDKVRVSLFFPKHTL